MLRINLHLLLPYGRAKITLEITDKGNKDQSVLIFHD